MRITLAPMIAMLISTAIYLPLCYLFVIKLEMDILGLAVAKSIDFFILLLTLIIYCNCSELTKSMIFLPNSDTFTGWGEYLKVSIPSTVMICAE